MQADNKNSEVSALVCRCCGYALHGLPDTHIHKRCPECGEGRQAHRAAATRYWCVFLAIACLPTVVLGVVPSVLVLLPGLDPTPSISEYVMIYSMLFSSAVFVWPIAVAFAIPARLDRSVIVPIATGVGLNLVWTCVFAALCYILILRCMTHF
jgi:hypothetical protein